MTCECRVCEYGREVEAHLVHLGKNDRAFFEAMYERLCNVEDERDYYDAIVKNKWPTSEEILKRYRPIRPEPPKGRILDG